MAGKLFSEVVGSRVSFHPSSRVAGLCTIKETIEKRVVSILLLMDVAGKHVSCHKYMIFNKIEAFFNTLFYYHLCQRTVDFKAF